MNCTVVKLSGVMSSSNKSCTYIPQGRFRIRFNFCLKEVRDIYDWNEKFFCKDLYSCTEMFSLCVHHANSFRLLVNMSVPNTSHLLFLERPYLFIDSMRSRIPLSNPVHWILNGCTGFTTNGNQIWIIAYISDYQIPYLFLPFLGWMKTKTSFYQKMLHLATKENSLLGWWWSLGVFCESKFMGTFKVWDNHTQQIEEINEAIFL